MATVIDISILNSVTIIIVFMLIFVGGWGLLQFVNPFKGSEKAPSFYGLLAFLVAVLVVMSRKTVGVIMIMTPWFVLLLFVAFFFIFFAKVFGADDASITTQFGKRGVGWMIFFVAIIVIFAIGQSFGQDLLSAQTPGQAPSVTNLPDGAVLNADGTVTMSDGTIVVPDAEGVIVPATGVASNDFGSNLVLTLFHPKILGVIFLFLMGTLTILLLNVGAGGH